MQLQPVVSVVIPIYNCARYVDDTIRSVLAQTYQHWELLLVDDGSTDLSDEIARRYAAALPRQIRYLEHDGHQNRGSSASRNLGIENARGQYVALLDADDVWLPEKLARQVRLLETHTDAVMTYGPLRFWYSWDSDAANRRTDFLQDLGMGPGVIRPPALLDFYIRYGAATPGTTALLARLDAVRAVGGFEEAFRSAYDDQVFYAKLALEFPIHIDDVSCSMYRRHSGSMMVIANRHDPRGLQRLRVEFLTWVENYINARGVDSGPALTSIRRELWPHRHPVLYHQKLLFARLALAPRRILQRFVTCPRRDQTLRPG